MGFLVFIPWLLKTSLVGSILVGLIIFIRSIFKNRLGPKWTYLLWFLLIIRLILPVAPESPLSILNLLHLFEPKSVENYIQDGQKLLGIETKPGHRESFQEMEHHSIAVERGMTPLGLFTIIWGLGVFALCAHTTYLNLRIRVGLRKCKVIKDPVVLGLFRQCQSELNSKDNVILVEGTISKIPLVIGVIKPYIVLPLGTRANLTQAELRYVLLHELAHVKRKDLWVNWLLYILQIMHWFNPFIWYGFYRLRLDREVCCDATVLAHLRTEEFRDYGLALISYLEKFPYWSPLIPVSSFGGSPFKERISRIATSNKQADKQGYFLMTVIFLLMALITLSDAEEASSYHNVKIKQLGDVKIVGLDQYFHDYAGSFVLYNLNDDRYEIYNAETSSKRFSPFSTYKIVSSLIGLETGVINEKTVISWDGTLYPVESWNQDHSLVSAIRKSVNWFFQEVDSRVGEKEIKRYFEQIDYGNCDISGGIKEFWLESSLRISPIEQVEFLRDMYTYKLPFAPSNVDVVKRAMRISEQPGAVLSGKTGSGIINDKIGIGWYIGYVEKGKDVFVFATHIQGNLSADGKMAASISRQILQDKNIL
ncbi:BlaR1 family beta-lactam sensor/signal transducer [Peptococcaceae bacterium 1198_IL3148]